jgi:hypothetical protein
MNEKYTIMNPFEITSKMMGPYMFSATSRESLGDKMELYFQDHAFMPLFIQVRYCHCRFLFPNDTLPLLKENYLKTEPARLRNYDGPMKQVKYLELMDKAASSISDGDLVDALIHGYVHSAFFLARYNEWAGQSSIGRLCPCMPCVRPSDPRPSYTAWARTLAGPTRLASPSKQAAPVFSGNAPE